MENASKALLIAGGVLIAILIVSVLVVTLNIVNSNQRTREKALATEQLAEFNQKYEAYNKKALKGHRHNNSKKYGKIRRKCC